MPQIMHIWGTRMARTVWRLFWCIVKLLYKNILLIWYDITYFYAYIAYVEIQYVFQYNYAISAVLLKFELHNDGATIYIYCYLYIY